VLQAARSVKDGDADALVSVGGGSVIDATKVVQYCVARDLFDEECLRKGASCTTVAGPVSVPHVCVPTTLSGAEFTHFAGARNPVTGLKEVFVDPALMPRTVIFDPCLTLRTPMKLWLSSGIRALDHAIEGLCSNRLHPLAELLAMRGVALLGESLKCSKLAPDDLEARRRSQFGAWFASVPLSSGVPMGASHAMGHVLGSLFDVPHGLTSCVLLPAVMQFNWEAVPDRFDSIAIALGGQRGAEAPGLLRRLIGELGLPSSLGELGIGGEAFERIVSGALEEGWTRTNPRPAGREELLQILEAAS
jgi:maleylacetate reductase